jgi:endonuclease/exonuclease/phosphatase family metal-dependent hydrolase
MTAQRAKTKVQALAGLVILGVATAPLLLPTTAEAGTQSPMYRKMTPPNVFYPVVGSKSVKDLATSTARRPGTDIKTACNAGVRAAHPGTVQVLSPIASGQRVKVIASGNGGQRTYYAHLGSVAVTNGQIVQSGQRLGKVGKSAKTGACTLYFATTRNKVPSNATAWLNYWVGRKPPVPNLFGTKGFMLASFNILGASHTKNSKRYATYPSRLNKAAALIDRNGFDVVGTQEFQETQFDYFKKQGYTNKWGAYYWNPPGKQRDTENLILWRKSTMEFVSGSTIDIPYFYGSTRHIPVVLLKEKSSGRTAYFLNTHNAADVRGPAKQYRTKAIAIEKAKIIELRRTGRPVFITGDFNDRKDAFCPMTANKLTISPNSVPHVGCVYPKQSSIDWIFAAGQARFSSYAYDQAAHNANVTDHPIVYARTHLQD